MNFDRFAGMASAIGFVLILTLVAWLQFWGPLNLEAVKQWQTLIGSVIAAIGIFAASWNVRRQMRLATRAREQDRIERELPGTRAALRFLNRMFDGKITADDVLSKLGKLGLLEPELVDQIDKGDELLPTTPDAIRREVMAAVYHVRVKAQTVVSTFNEALIDEEAKLNRPVRIIEFGDEEHPYYAARKELYRRKWEQAEVADAVAEFKKSVGAIGKLRSDLRWRVLHERRRLDHLRKLSDKLLGI
jgi:hypothetical protein